MMRSESHRLLFMERFEERVVLSSLSLLPRQLFASDNSTRTARDIGSLDGAFSIKHQYVGPFDQRDVFRFELRDDGEASIRLHELRADADVYLLNRQRETLATSRNGGRQDDSIQTNLEAGEYFVVVQHYDPWRGTGYSLDVAATIAAPADLIGDSFGTAKDLGSLRGTQSLRDAVGNGDLRDVFRFDIDETSHVDFTLTGLSADVDLHLYSHTGVKLASSNRPGRSAEQLRAWIAKGSYYLVVDAYRGAKSAYDLRLTSSLDRLPRTPGAPISPDPSPPESAPTDPDASNDPPVDSPVPDVRPGSPQQDPESEPELPLLDPSEPLANVPYFGSSTDWGLNSVNAPEAWAAGYTGEGITVAVIDSGVQSSHLDLAHSIWVNADEIPGDGIDNDRNGYVDDVRGWDFIDRDNSPSDENGHGTHVAGIIAAANNSVGGTGVAYASTIMPIRVLDEAGSGSTTGVAQGIRYAVDNGADIINLSLGGGNSQSVYSALRYAEQNNVLVVAASGNENAEVPGYPAAHSASLPNVLSVGAYTSSGRRASFSNQVGNSGTTQVDAPGQSIYNTYLGGRYRTLSGTSMATPFVSGVAALALSANPSLSANLIRSVITQSVSAAAAGSDALGRVNAAAAVPLAIAGNVDATLDESHGVAPSPSSFSASLRMYALGTTADAVLASRDVRSDLDFDNIELEAWVLGEQALARRTEDTVGDQFGETNGQDLEHISAVQNAAISDRDEVFATEGWLTDLRNFLIS